MVGFENVPGSLTIDQAGHPEDGRVVLNLKQHVGRPGNQSATVGVLVETALGCRLRVPVSVTYYGYVVESDN